MRQTLESDRLELLLEGLSGAGWERLQRRAFLSDTNVPVGWGLLARRGTARLLLCEMAIGRAFPGYAERRSWRCGPGMGSHDVLLITDAAHREFVLAGPVEAAGRRLYCEECVEIGPRGLSESLAPFEKPPAPGLEVGPAERRDAERAIASSLRSVVGGGSRSGDALDVDLFSWAAASTDFAAIRGFLRALNRMVIVDGCCVSHDWLLAAAEFLEACYIAALCRYRSFTIDAAGRERPDARVYGDSERRAFDAEDAPERDPQQDRRKTRLALPVRQLNGLDRTAIRGAIVRRQIAGLTDTRSDADHIRRVLLAFAAEPGTRFPSLDTNVRSLAVWGGRAGDPTEAGAARTAPDGAPVPPNRHGGDPLNPPDDVSCFSSAWRLLADARENDQWTIEEWRRAARDFGRARRRLERRRSGIGQGKSGAGSGFDPTLLAPGFRSERLLVLRRT